MDEEFTPYSAPASGAELAMPPRRIERTLRRQTPEKGEDGKDRSSAGSFARIYSFSYEGHYYKLPRPLLFLVNGKGERLEEKDGDPGALKFNTKLTGVEARDWRFSNDLRVWAVDKKDLAVCLDVEVANYEQLLLDSMIAFEEDMATRGSATARGSASARGSPPSTGFSQMVSEPTPLVV